MGRCMGPPQVRKQYFACDLDPFKGRNKHFSHIFPRQLSRPLLIVQLPYVYNSFRMCKIASVRVQQRPYVYNSVRACIMTSSTQIFKEFSVDYLILMKYLKYEEYECRLFFVQFCRRVDAGADNRTKTLRADPPTDRSFNGQNGFRPDTRLLIMNHSNETNFELYVASDRICISVKVFYLQEQVRPTKWGSLYLIFDSGRWHH